MLSVRVDVPYQDRKIVMISMLLERYDYDMIMPGLGCIQAETGNSPTVMYCLDWLDIIATTATSLSM